MNCNTTHYRANSSSVPGDPTGDGWGVYGKRYTLIGLVQGDEFGVNSTTAGDQTAPSVARDGVGDFLVAWSSNGQDGDGQGIYAQQFSQIGQALENEFHVSTTTAGDQSNATVAMDSKGHLMIAWSGNGVGDADGVFFQRYAVNTASEGKEPAGDAFDPLGDGDEGPLPPSHHTGHSPVETSPITGGWSEYSFVGLDDGSTHALSPVESAQPAGRSDNRKDSHRQGDEGRHHRAHDAVFAGLDGAADDSDRSHSEGSEAVDALALALTLPNDLAAGWTL